MSELRALVLDDDSQTANLLARIAGTVGYDAVAITSANDFASHYDEGVPALIMLDLQLGETDGVQQLRYLKGRDYLNPLILMSGFDARVLATTETLAKNIGLKVAGSLTKPIRAAKLKEMLERIKQTSAPINAEAVIEAAKAGELELDHQPIVASRAGPVLHLECLVRWNHPTRGRLAPGAFLPAVENDDDAIGKLTDWVIGAAIADYQRMREAGVTTPVAVNLSARNLDWVDLPDVVHDRLVKAGVPTADFGFELTESAAAASATSAMDILSRLRLKGHKLAADDFGVGYSSLTMLRQMPFSVLKIDGSFVKDMTNSNDSLAIVKAILAIAQAMDMETIAECVETDEQAAILESLGAGALQGYFIAKPMPLPALIPWLKKRAGG